MTNHLFSLEQYLSKLRTRRLGRSCVYLDLVDSTINVASKENLDTLVLAKEQTQGRGQRTNVWHSPAGCAMGSIRIASVKSQPLAKRLCFLQHILALSAAWTLEKIDPVKLGKQHIKLKWPNDIIYKHDGKLLKIGGVLVHTREQLDDIDITLSFGLNVLNKEPTTCISEIIGSSEGLSIDAVVAEMMNFLEQFTYDLDDEKFRQVKADYLERCLQLDSIVDDETHGSVRIKDIDDDGYLLGESCSTQQLAKLHEWNLVDMNNNQFHFTEEILSMMHAFGDSSQPMPESARLIESIVHEQLDALIYRAEEVAQLRDAQVVGPEEILFLLRKDKSKLVRLINHLYVKDIRQTLNDGSTVGNPATEYRVFDVTKSQQTRRVKLCYDYLSQLDEFGEYKKVFNQALFDEIKNQRMRRMDSITRNMSHAEYSNYTKARQVSFISRIKPDKFSEWLLAGKPETKISVYAFEMIQYLAHETVAQIVDFSLLVKQDTERDPHDPLSVLITGSSHNKSEKVNLPSQCQQQHQSKSFNIQYNDNKTSGHPRCITPNHIYEAMRRYCSPKGPYREFHTRGGSSALAILCI